jgi:glucose/arabinose dehydrogenase
MTTLAGSGKFGFVDGKGDEAQFGRPSGIAVDSDGSVIVDDAHFNVIRRITPDGAR